MARRNNPSFDLKTYLPKISRGTTQELRKKEAIFSQGSPANAVFYIKDGKVKLTVLSGTGKKRSSPSWEAEIFLVKGASRASRCAWPRRPR